MRFITFLLTPDISDNFALVILCITISSKIALMTGCTFAGIVTDRHFLALTGE